MDIQAALRATSLLSVRRCVIRQSSRHIRYLHASLPSEAQPLPHTPVAGPPPGAPQAAVDYPQDRLVRKRQRAELLIESQKAKVNPAKPASALQKRFWKNVVVKDTEAGLQILLDNRPVRTAGKQILTLPHSKRALATSIAVEWDSLITAQQALKHHYIPITSLVSRAVDLETADRNKDTTLRNALVQMLMRYLSTDTLLCWAPETNIHEPAHQGQKNLRERQRSVAEPIIAFLKTHVFPGNVDIMPILGESIMPTPQPEVTRDVIRQWITSLPPYELAALERGVLATKSLLVASRLLVAWSKEFRHLQNFGTNGTGGVLREAFGIDQATEAATLEVVHQIEQWGEVEDTHDVEREDLRRQLGSVVLLQYKTTHSLSTVAKYQLYMTISTPICDMGQKHNNRKRIRHRPLRDGGRARPMPVCEHEYSPPLVPNVPSSMCDAGNQEAYCSSMWPSSSTTPLSSYQPESALALDRRIFGDSDEDDDSNQMNDLRGAMLDIVLGLFNGVDYDDGGI
nr:protein atp12, mitochondrial [Quercus suber]